MLQRSDFAGLWRIERRIEDRYSSQTGAFEGEAMLTESGAHGLHYVETGMLRLGSAPAMTATRRYNWTFDDDGVSVTFADGAPFHAFVPEDATEGTDHLCGDDLYKVAYDFTRWPDWSARWSVAGPRKEYTLHSFYSRRLP